MKVNRLQKNILFEKMETYFNGLLSDKQITVWGLAFKPETDDIREAPALVLIDQLLDAGAKVKTYDPEAMPNVKALYGDQIEFCDSPYEALRGSNALALCTEWSIFRTIDHNQLKNLMREPIVFDGRNVFESKEMIDSGIEYFSIGRPFVSKSAHA